MVVRRAVLLATAGVVFGLAASYTLTRLFSSLLFEIDPTDPRVFALMAGVLLAVAAAASFIPARRAATVDPVVALKHE